MDYNSLRTQHIREQIIEACLALQAKDFIIGTWGNVSIRDGDVFYLTPSRVSYDVMKPEDIVVVHVEDGVKLCGEYNPSSEKEVHRLIYKARPDVGSVIHCHSPYATALSAAWVAIPPIVEEMSQLIGGEIPCTSQYVRAELHHELGVEVAGHIGDKNACLIRNHGPVCCGTTLEEAMLVCTVTEKAARMYAAITHDIEAKAIPEEYVKSERYRFIHSYGKEQ